MKKPVGYICEPCEILTIELIQRIEEAHENFQVFGVGVYSDKFFLELNGRQPIKSYTDRAKLVSALKGVDFVFELDENTDIDPELNFCDSSTVVELDKPYHVGYAPGTYDLFHEGHLEHLTDVKSLCDILVVGVNSDDLVWENKHKKVAIHQNERAEIVRNLDFVDYVFIVEDNLKSLQLEECYKLCQKEVDVIFMGSDLKDSNAHNDTNVPILFTERDPVLMQRRSSTFYRKAIEKLSKK